MRDLDTHVAHALALVSPLPARSVALQLARNAVTATDVRARTPSPVFDNSAMDGYAVRAADVVGASTAAPRTLTVAGETAAGAPPAVLPEGAAWRIMTGAPVPHGADAIVPVELTDGGTQTVTIHDAVPVGRHIRRAGEDAAIGDVVVRAGVHLTAARLAALAAVGVGEIDVVDTPRVAVLATGDELVEPGTPLAPGQIYDSNSVLMAGLVAGAGAEPVTLERTSDDPDELLARLAGADADLIVTSGGVSVGAYDVVKAALSERGVEFVKVAMQPGKPQGLGLLDGTPIACLPGNPVSVLVSFAVIVAPMIARLRGLRPDQVRETAVVAQGWRTPPSRRQFMPVRFVAPGQVTPATVGGSGSHLMASLAQAEALAEIDAAIDEVLPGDTVTIRRWNG